MDSSEHEDPSVTAQDVAARFACPSWCDQDHHWEPGDDTHWVTHTRQFAWSFGLNVEVWQVVIADGDRLTEQSAVLHIETASSVTFTPETARHVLHDLRVAVDGAIDLADALNSKGSS